MNETAKKPATPPPRWRFTLSDLLFAMIAVAVVLAWYAESSKNSGALQDIGFVNDTWPVMSFSQAVQNEGYTAESQGGGGGVSNLRRSEVHDWESSFTLDRGAPTHELIAAFKRQLVNRLESNGCQIESVQPEQFAEGDGSLAIVYTSGGKRSLMCANIIQVEELLYRTFMRVRGYPK